MSWARDGAGGCTGRHAHAAVHPAALTRCHSSRFEPSEGKPAAASSAAASALPVLLPAALLLPALPAEPLAPPLLPALALAAAELLPASSC